MSVMSIAEARPAWPAAGQPFTTDDLDRMPDDGRRYELLDGVLFVSPKPGMVHQAVATRLAHVLSGVCPEDMIVIAEAAVQLTRATEFDPDIIVTRPEEVEGAKLTVPPLLAVEVRSPRTAVVDLTRKKDAYAAFGVPSYWIVVPDIRRPELTVYELADGSYEESGHVVGDQRFGATRPFPVEVVPARLVERLGRGD